MKQLGVTVGGAVRASEGSLKWAGVRVYQDIYFEKFIVLEV